MRTGVALLFLLFALGCSKSDAGGAVTVVPRGNRMLGMDFLDPIPSSDFSSGMALAKQVGVEGLGLHLLWSTVEANTPANCSDPGTYTDPGGALAIFDALLPGEGISMALGMLPSTTNIAGMPGNLTGLAMDNALVICRYNMMLDWLLTTKIPNLALTSLSIGNEMESAPGATVASYWTSYAAFVAAVATHAHALRPGLKVTVSAGLPGLVGTSSNPTAEAGFAAVYVGADVVGVNFYPMGPNAQVLPLSSISEGFDDVVARYPSKPIHFNEIGYQSSATCGSSEEQQAGFVREVFKAWDEHAAQVEYVSFLRLNDRSLSDAQAVAASYGLGGDTYFIEYIRTLGLRSYDGGEKSALGDLRSATSARGW